MKLFYIKERTNPQLTTYYVALGQLTKRDAQRCTKPVYGVNIVRSFETKDKYESELKALRDRGEIVK